jgi:UDP-N-acetylmuramoylalanine--D-glutamate ligase
VIGITGSAGKTTTTTLVGRIGEAATAPCIQAAAGNGDRQTRSEPRAGFEKIDLFYPHKVWVGGNIGNPLIDQVDQMGPDDLSVMELSSFQLEIMTRSPQVAAVLNITPNHLDRHGTMAAYTAAKERILENQTPGDVAVLGRDDPGSWNLSGRARGQIVSFGRRALQPGQSGTLFQAGQVLFRTSAGEYKPLLFREDILLRGEHNLYNVLAAGAIACAAGLPPKAVRAGVIGFTGVSHRLEFVRTWGGADWYNDSIATAPERTLAAIRSFNEPLVLLLGGRDKNLPWEDLAELVNSRVDHLIVFGEAAEKIVKVVEAAKVASRTPQRAGVEAGNQGSPAWEAPKGAEIVRCSGLRQAFEAAAGIVTPGDVVLLSPGGTSFDEFHDFEARGEAYRQWVKELP